MVTDYCDRTGLTSRWRQLGFHTVGYGCMTCIGNSGPLPEAVANAVSEGNLVAAAVLSGNRNFEGRINPLVKANYLASPPLVVAYALAGTMDIDMIRALGTGSDGGRSTCATSGPRRQRSRQRSPEAVLPKCSASDTAMSFDGTRMERDSGNRKRVVPLGSEEHVRPRAALLAGHAGRAGTDPADPRRPGAGGPGRSVTTDHISPAGSIALPAPPASTSMSTV